MFPLPIEGQVRSAMQETLTLLRQRFVRFARLVVGGALGGFYIGTLAFGFCALIVCTLEKNIGVGLEHVLMGGAATAALGAGWGIFLALTEPSDKPSDTASTVFPPSSPNSQRDL